MLFVIDVGNTNVTTGLVRDGEIVGTHRAATRLTDTVDELDLLVGQILSLDAASATDLTGIAVASVVPVLTERLEAVAARHGLPLVVASAGTVPIAIRVERPSDVGPDRLVNALAAQRLHGAPAVVVDFGTATTFDAVAPDGAYVGGAIAPGLEIGLDALAARTARLPRVPLRAPDRAIGRDTVSAIQSGAVLGHVALTAGLLGQIRRELAASSGIDPAAVRTIATGGLAGAAWMRDLDGIDAVDPELTLRGLAILYAEVAGGERLELGIR